MRRANWSLTLALLTVPAASMGAPDQGAGEMPWREAGLTERQAALHLLNRFTYGPRPGDIDRVVEEGLEVWFERQLTAELPEPDLDARLVELEPLFVPVEEVAMRYPSAGRVLRQAMEEGVLPEDFDPQAARATARSDPGSRSEARDMRNRLAEFRQERGYRPQRELIGALLTQKVYRALYAENQLAEVLTDFWFNHFNVSLTDNQSRGFVLSYERDAIRPFVLGSFAEMLAETARHPAMLLYLDNAQSTANEGERTTLEHTMEARLGGRGRRGGSGMQARSGRSAARRASRPARSGAPGRARSQGLNENYARELLELHTLGVDGGYSQEDVVEVARAFTGWTVVRPEMATDPDARRRVQRALGLGAGFVVEGGFVFRADAHDAGKKRVLGHTLAAGRGIEDGLQVLDIVARHPATAMHLAGKLAVRFVADEPPPELVDRLAERFVASGGAIAPVMRELVAAPEFWAPEANGAKVKSPLELAASAVRALAAEVADPRGIVGWIERMGQPLYAYQAPTGYPDTGAFWVNGGALLNRMNFGLSLAAGRIPGVRLDLSALADGREPESRPEALATYASILLPERDTGSMVALLEPMVMAPDLVDRIEAAWTGTDAPPLIDPADFGVFAARRFDRSPARTTPPTAVEQVAGVVLGSPQFQRR